ncbi:MAG: hypothetical protein ACRDY1_13400 [Acidimicrobiales bacterium]
MSMYVDLLSSALGGLGDGLTGLPLIDHARRCRDALTRPAAYGARRSADVLAVEIAYDRALIRLCTLHAIAVDPRAFLFPHEARERLEAELAVQGVSLEVRRPPDGGPGPRS